VCGYFIPVICGLMIICATVIFTTDGMKILTAVLCTAAIYMSTFVTFCPAANVGDLCSYFMQASCD
jgi:hypothetical protein